MHTPAPFPLQTSDVASKKPKLDDTVMDTSLGSMASSDQSELGAEMVPCTPCESSSTYTSERSERYTGSSMDAIWVNMRNSTSSVFASSTISTPNPSEVLVSTAVIICIQMRNDARMPLEMHNQFQFFRVLHPILGTSIENESTMESIYTFLECMFSCGRISTECIVIALIYVNRIITSTGFLVNVHNWPGLLCGAFLLAHKVWDDISLGTSKFAKLINLFPEVQVRLFEREILSLLQYDVTVTSKLYTQYYFELREMSSDLFRTRSAEQVHNPLRPLEIWRAKRLELKSNSFKMQRMSDSASGDQTTEAGRTRGAAKSIAVECASLYNKCGTSTTGRGRYVLP